MGILHCTEKKPLVDELGFTTANLVLWGDEVQPNTRFIYVMMKVGKVPMKFE